MFLCAFQVVMLRSVGDLLRYIDEHHLASDFTAKVECCQSDWVILCSVGSRSVTAKPRRVSKQENPTTTGYWRKSCACLCLQSIETFAVTVKEIAQLLQGFGSELSDTELPDEATAIEFLEHSHTHRYRQMKVAAVAPWSPLVSLLSLSDCLHMLWFCARLVRTISAGC